jgi:DMSO reductase anchor subunit
VVLTLPGVAYLAALRELDDLNYGTVPTILVILGFNAMLLILLEVPLIEYVVAPERTVAAVQDFRSWLSRNGLKAGIYVAAGLGLLLIARGVIEFLT